jgi:ABC-type lipoprotein export system ATPase subunit
MLVLAQKEHVRLPLADAAEGLLKLEAGRVAFMGADWEPMTPDQAVAARARIGRVFRGPAWISNLDADENITLRERHFSRRPPDEIESEALALARSFGLEDLPRKRPAWVPRDDLMRAQWVRALLGAPALLLAEFPETGVPDDGLDAWRGAVAKARAAGAAIVWFTCDPRVWNDGSLKPRTRCEMRGAELRVCEEHGG